jgi:hypothetical protein
MGDISSSLEEGVLINAPVGIGPLIGRPLRWTFLLRQQPDDICFRFEKLDPSTMLPASAHPVSAGYVKVSRRSQPKPSKEVEIRAKTTG